MTDYVFSPLRPEDLPRVNAWCRTPHVARWWDDEVIDADDIRDPRTALWLVSCDGAPLGFLQDYRVDAWDSHPLQDLPAGARGLDLFIGPPEMLGHGHGRGMVTARTNALFSEGAPAVGADPHPHNSRSIGMFRACGFAPVGPEVQSVWGPVLPLARQAGHEVTQQ